MFALRGHFGHHHATTSSTSSRRSKLGQTAGHVSPKILEIFILSTWQRLCDWLIYGQVICCLPGSSPHRHFQHRKDPGEEAVSYYGPDSKGVIRITKNFLRINLFLFHFVLWETVYSSCWKIRTENSVQMVTFCEFHLCWISLRWLTTVSTI